MGIIDLFLKAIGLLLFLTMKYVALFISLEVHGGEHVPKGAYLLCPMHKGDLDAYLIRRALRDRPTFNKRNRYLFRLKSKPWVQRLFLLYWEAGSSTSQDRT